MFLLMLMYLMELPRTTSKFSRSPVARSPLASSFVRYQSGGGEEKVKGQVIGQCPVLPQSLANHDPRLKQIC